MIRDMLDRPVTLIVGSTLFVAVSYLTVRAEDDAQWLIPYLGGGAGIVFGSVVALALILSARSGAGSRWLYAAFGAVGLLMLIGVYSLGPPIDPVTRSADIATRAFLYPFAVCGTLGAIIGSVQARGR